MGLIGSCVMLIETYFLSQCGRASYFVNISVTDLLSANQRDGESYIDGQQTDSYIMSHLRYI